jgi:hypothetical protein
MHTNLLINIKHYLNGKSNNHHRSHDNMTLLQMYHRLRSTYIHPHNLIHRMFPIDSSCSHTHKNLRYIDFNHLGLCRTNQNMYHKFLGLIRTNCIHSGKNLECIRRSWRSLYNNHHIEYMSHRFLNSLWSHNHQPYIH